MTNEERIKLTAMIQTARDDFMLRTELFAIVAQEARAKYDAYISVGFTPEQAIYLLK